MLRVAVFVLVESKFEQALALVFKGFLGIKSQDKKINEAAPSLHPWTD